MSVGLHPKLVGPVTEEQKEAFNQLMNNTRDSAVGEVDFDISMIAGQKSLQEQKDF